MSIDELLINILKKGSNSIGDKDVLPISDSIVFKKVAFDFYKVDNDPYMDLWTMQELDDGSVALVRAYDSSKENKVIGDWVAISDHGRENITLNYKNAPIACLAADEYGFDKDNIFEFKEALLDKVSSDKDFLNDLLSTQPKDKRTALELTFPEWFISKES